MRNHVFLFSAAILAFALPLKTLAAAPINLPVPLVWEIPNGTWTKPWNGACEEASIEMAENFYLNNHRTFSHPEMKKLMWPLFGIEDRLFGSNSDTNSTRTLKLINDYTMFDASLKINPTVEDIKNEVNAGHPVISLHYGYALKNPRHRFRRGGSSYHMMVITGFDDAKKIFFANDPELPDGIDYPYNYAIIMNSLHDFNQATHKADGPPTVLFSKPKQIVQLAGGHRTYLVRGGTKYYIASPAAFTSHRWLWSAVTSMPADELNKLDNGAAITK